MSKSKKKNKNSDFVSDKVLITLRVLSKIFNDVGFTGFSVIVFTTILFWFSNKTQKNEIIDTWILFKTDNNIICAIIVILTLIFLLIVQQVYYRGKINDLKQRINEMADEKAKLHSLLTDKKFSSSNIYSK